MMTYSAALGALRRKVRADAVRRQVRAALVAADARERAEADADAAERAEIARLGDEAQARAGGFGTRWPRHLDRAMSRERRVRRLCERSLCPCEDCEERRACDPMQERRPRPRRPLSAHEAVQHRLHEAETARVCALWRVLVWAPEAAAEAAAHRPDVRLAASGSAWSRLRDVLEGLGIVRREVASAVVERHRKLAGWLEVCPRTGPPAVRPGIGSVRVISP